MNPDREKLLRLIDEVKLVPAEGRGPFGWVYFIACHETGRIKIGFTKGDPMKRIAALQTGCSTELALIACHPGTPNTEKLLHEKFKNCRLHREWFAISDELRAYIIDTCWAMCEITLRAGQKLAPWMMVGLDYSIKRLGSLPEGLAEALEQA
jgi:hypothetical protein